MFEALPVSLSLFQICRKTSQFMFSVIHCSFLDTQELVEAAIAVTKITWKSEYEQ